MDFNNIDTKIGSIVQDIPRNLSTLLIPLV